MNGLVLDASALLAYASGEKDAAHAIATALLYRCYPVTGNAEVAAAAGRLGVETLDLTETWD